MLHHPMIISHVGTPWPPPRVPLQRDAGLAEHFPGGPPAAPGSGYGPCGEEEAVAPCNQPGDAPSPEAEEEQWDEQLQVGTHERG